MESDPVVRDNPDLNRYEILLGDEIVGISRYRVEPGVVVFMHTEIDADREGQGLGSRLAKGALDDVRARGLRVAAECPFIGAYLRRHRREYEDILVP